jgi:transposase
LIDDADPDALLGDKAYDADPWSTSSRNGESPRCSDSPKANRKSPRDCERNFVERFFNKLKHYRAIATRYDKLARNFLAEFQLVSAIILLN